MNAANLREEVASPFSFAAIAVKTSYDSWWEDRKLGLQLLDLRLDLLGPSAQVTNDYIAFFLKNLTFAFSPSLVPSKKGPVMIVRNVLRLRHKSIDNIHIHS
jgi:hypothetical protein